MLAEEIPRITEELPRIGRDPKDDYLIAHAVAAGAEYLVSWDKDLLDLDAVEGVAIVDPPGLLHAFRAAGLFASRANGAAADRGESVGANRRFGWSPAPMRPRS